MNKYQFIMNIIAISGTSILFKLGIEGFLSLIKKNKKRLNILKSLNTELVEQQKKLSHNKALQSYTATLSNALNVYYPNYKFNVTIKKIDNNFIYTINEIDEKACNRKGVLSIKENSEFYSIINENHKFFFVSDLNTYNNSISAYKSSNQNWKEEYKTSMSFPIKSKSDEIIGFVCITSPQKLNDTKKNHEIIKLINTSSNNLYKLLPKNIK